MNKILQKYIKCVIVLINKVSFIKIWTIKNKLIYTKFFLVLLS